MKWVRIRCFRRLAWLMLAALLLQSPVGGKAAAEAELELEIAEYPAANYEPGPGWPEGWSPPPPPESMSEQMRAEVERVLNERPDRYERYDWWVWDPLPAWTQEYPWYWEEDWMVCGTAVVAQIICQHVLNIVRLCRTENIEDRIIRRGAVLSVFVRQGTNMRACPGL